MDVMIGPKRLLATFAQLIVPLGDEVRLTTALGDTPGLFSMVLEFRDVEGGPQVIQAVGEGTGGVRVLFQNWNGQLSMASSAPTRLATLRADGAALELLAFGNRVGSMNVVTVQLMHGGVANV